MRYEEVGKGEWSDWGMSNSVRVYLTKGENQIQIVYKASNQNMNGEINQAAMDYVRLIKL